MNQRFDGGPAFPEHAHMNEPRLIQSGMSMRDWLAGKAMAAMVKGHHVSERLSATNCRDIYKHIAECSYALADAMLAERKNT